MKKVILFTGVLYVMFLLSFKEKSGEPEPFAKVLKDHPERITELLLVAEKYRDTIKISEKILSSDDILSESQLKTFRSTTKSRCGNKTHPVIVISTQALNELIKNHLQEEDSLVFYLGKYTKKDPERIKRYNARNSYPFTNGKDTYTYKDLKKRTAFAMQVFSTVKAPNQHSKSSSSIFKAENFLGPIGKGNHDLEMNSDLKNKFKTEKIARSPAYEISRLCPPPPEGCF